MVSALFNQTNYVAVKKMLDATVLRHEAIASNLANIETPGYRRVDVAPSFSAELQSAIASRDAAHISSLQPAISTDQQALPQRRDGNTVSLEQELLDLNQNTLAHSLETRLITGQLLRLKLAILGKPI